MHMHNPLKEIRIIIIYIQIYSNINYKKKTLKNDYCYIYRMNRKNRTNKTNKTHRTNITNRI